MFNVFNILLLYCRRKQAKWNFVKSKRQYVGGGGGGVKELV